MFFLLMLFGKKIQFFFVEQGIGPNAIGTKMLIVITLKIFFLGNASSTDLLVYQLYFGACIQ